MVEYKAKAPTTITRLDQDFELNTPMGRQYGRAGDYLLTFQEQVAPGAVRQWHVIIPPLVLGCFVTAEEPAHERTPSEVPA